MILAWWMEAREVLQERCAYAGPSSKLCSSSEVFEHLGWDRLNLIVRSQVCFGRHELYADEFEGWKAW